MGLTYGKRCVLKTIYREGCGRDIYRNASRVRSAFQLVYDIGNWVVFEFVYPRIDILEQERIIRSEFRFGFVVETVHQIQIGIDIRIVCHGIERVPSLFESICFYRCHNPVQNSCTRPVGEPAERRICRSVPRLIGGGTKEISIVGCLVRQEGDHGEHAEESKG